MCTNETSNVAQKYMKQKVIQLEGEIDKCTTIPEDFNTPLSAIHRTK